MLQPGFLLQRCSCYICSLAILRRYATMFHGFWLLSKAIGGKSNMAKRTISILALILTFLAATAAVAETWYIQTDNGKPLNIRSGPSKTSGIVATAENGIPLEVVELLEDGTWAKVVYHNQTGYCMTAFLTRDQEPEGSDLGYSIVYDESLFSYEQAGGIDTYWWKAQEPGKPNCYLSVSRLTGYTLDEAMEGLILQSGFEGTRSTLVLDGQVTSTFTFAEGTEADDAVTQYVCVPLSDGSILLVELSYYVAAEETAGQALQEMLHSITFSTPETSRSPTAASNTPNAPTAANGLKRGTFSAIIFALPVKQPRRTMPAAPSMSSVISAANGSGQAMSFATIFASPIPTKITSMMKSPSLRIIPRHDRPGKITNKKSPLRGNLEVTPKS